MQQAEREQRIEQLRGSRRWSASEARYVLETWKASGEPMLRFARRMRLGVERLRWWSKRLQGNEPALAGKTRPEMAGFVPVVVKAEPVSRAPQMAAVLVVEGARVELRELNSASAMWAAAVLQTLSGRP